MRKIGTEGAGHAEKTEAGKPGEIVDFRERILYELGRVFDECFDAISERFPDDLRQATDILASRNNAVINKVLKKSDACTALILLFTWYERVSRMNYKNLSAEDVRRLKGGMLKARAMVEKLDKDLAEKFYNVVQLFPKDEQ